MEAKPAPSEPEVIVDWTPLDTSSPHSVWLVRVPRIIAEQWESQPEGADLGRIFIHPAGSGEAQARLSAHLNTGGTDYGEWELPYHIPTGLNIFSEDVAGTLLRRNYSPLGNVALEGIVQYQMEMIPKDETKLRLVLTGFF